MTMRMLYLLDKGNFGLANKHHMYTAYRKMMTMLTLEFCYLLNT